MNDLFALGFSDALASQLAQLNDNALRPARVAIAYRDVYELVGAEVSRAEVTGSLRHRAASPLDLPCVGDWVAVKDGRIHAILPRRSLFVRKAAGERTAAQAIAANIDIAFLVTSLNRDFNPRRIERYLTAVWDSGARPVLVLNKADLCSDVEACVDALGPSAIGVTTCVVSAHTGLGLEALGRLLGPGVTAALVGSSGVGKSTLVNCLAGGTVQRTGAVREDDDRGRHTTTHRELLILPGGGLLIDTPGMRELGLWDAGEGIAGVFGEIEALAEGCRFRDCTHQGEPGCAVLAQVDEGRLESYRKLQREEAHQEHRRNAQHRREEKQIGKHIAKSLRARKRMDKKLQLD